ncbi:hypothetical protein ES705_38833 [subsurface metagenome]
MVVNERNTKMSKRELFRLQTAPYRHLLNFDFRILQVLSGRYNHHQYTYLYSERESIVMWCGGTKWLL